MEQTYSQRKNYILPFSVLLKGECSFGDKLVTWMEKKKKWIWGKEFNQNLSLMRYDTLERCNWSWLPFIFPTSRCSVHRRINEDNTRMYFSSLNPWRREWWCNPGQENGYSTHQQQKPRKSLHYSLSSWYH